MRKRGILLAAAVLLTANGCGRYEEVSVEPLLEAQTAGDRPGGAFREDGGRAGGRRAARREGRED